LDLLGYLEILRRRWRVCLFFFLLGMGLESLLFVFVPSRWQTAAALSVSQIEFPPVCRKFELPAFQDYATKEIRRRIEEKDFREKIRKQLRLNEKTFAGVRWKIASGDSRGGSLRLSLEAPGENLCRAVLAAITETLTEEIRRSLEKRLHLYTAKMEEWRTRTAEERTKLESELEALFGPQDETPPLPYYEAIKSVDSRIAAFRGEAEELSRKERETSGKLKELSMLLPIDLLGKGVASTFITNQLRRRLEAMLDLQIKLKREMAKKTDIHPEIIKLKEDLARAQAVFESFLEAKDDLPPLLLAAYKTAKDKLKQRKARLESELAEARGKAISVTRRLAALEETRKKLRNNRARYADLFRRYSALRTREEDLAAAEEKLKTTIRYRPHLLAVQAVPEPPKRLGLTLGRFTYFALVTAALAAVALTLSVEFLNEKVRNEITLGKRFKAPVLAALREGDLESVSSGDAGENGPLGIVWQKLHRSGGERISVLVTSCDAGTKSGKVAVGLARAAAALGDRVLIVESDPTREELSFLSPFPLRNGLGSVLSGHYALKRKLEHLAGNERRFLDGLAQADSGRLPAARRTSIPGVDMIPWGTEDNEEPFLQTRLGPLLSEWKKSYSFIVVHTPDALNSPYPAILGSVSDGTLLAVSLHRTAVRSLNHTLRRWEGTGIRLFGFVLCDFDSSGMRPSVTGALVEEAA